MKQEIGTEIKQELVKQALAARKFAYVPYSKFRVGAAVLAKNGAIYTGCNIENAAYTPTNCAERTAVFKAVSEGITEFDAIAVCGGPGEAEPEDFCTPCGVCRQVLREFVDPNEFLVLLCRQLFVEACYAGVHFYAGSCIYRLGTADERKLYLLASGRTGCERGCLGRHQYCDFSDAVCLCTVRTPCQLCQLLLNNGWVCRIFFIHARLDICGISKGYQDFKHSGR